MIKYNSNLPENRGLELIDDFTVRKTAHLGTKGALDVIEAIVKFYEANPDPLVVKVNNFQYYGIRHKNLYQYSYDMDRLGPLDNDEESLLTIGFDASWHGIDPFDKSNFIYFDHVGYKKENVPKLLEDNKKLISFIRKVIDQNRYQDRHSGNVMRNSDNEFVLLDLEGFMLEYNSLSNYQWLPQQS